MFARGKERIESAEGRSRLLELNLRKPQPDAHRFSRSDVHRIMRSRFRAHAFSRDRLRHPVNYVVVDSIFLAQPALG